MVGDGRIWDDPLFLELQKEGAQLVLVDTAIGEEIAESGFVERISGEDDGKLLIVDLIKDQHPGKGGNGPFVVLFIGGQAVVNEIDRETEVPPGERCGTRSDAEVSIQTKDSLFEAEAILGDGKNSLGDSPLGVAESGVSKGNLLSKTSVTLGADEHPDDDTEEDSAGQMNVDQGS